MISTVKSQVSTLDIEKDSGRAQTRIKERQKRQQYENRQAHRSNTTVTAQAGSHASTCNSTCNNTGLIGIILHHVRTLQHESRTARPKKLVSCVSSCKNMAAAHSKAVTSVVCPSQSKSPKEETETLGYQRG